MLSFLQDTLFEASSVHTWLVEWCGKDTYRRAEVHQRQYSIILDLRMLAIAKLMMSDTYPCLGRRQSGLDFILGMASLQHQEFLVMELCLYQ